MDTNRTTLANKLRIYQFNRDYIRDIHIDSGKMLINMNVNNELFI